MISLTWILAIVGALGIGGTIAACVLFPAIAIPVIQSIMRELLACKACMVVILVVGVGIGSWWFGHHKAVIECRADELAAELRNKQIDLENAKKSAADEAERADTIEATANDQKAKDAAFIEQLKSRPAPACVLDDPDLLPRSLSRKLNLR